MNVEQMGLLLSRIQVDMLQRVCFTDNSRFSRLPAPAELASQAWT
jgi:hypothetical protein